MIIFLISSPMSATCFSAYSGGRAKGLLTLFFFKVKDLNFSESGRWFHRGLKLCKIFCIWAVLTPNRLRWLTWVLIHVRNRKAEHPLNFPCLESPVKLYHYHYFINLYKTTFAYYVRWLIQSAIFSYFQTIVYYMSFNTKDFFAYSDLYYTFMQFVS